MIGFPFVPLAFIKNMYSSESSGTVRRVNVSPVLNNDAARTSGCFEWVKNCLKGRLIKGLKIRFIRKIFSLLLDKMQMEKITLLQPKRLQLTTKVVEERIIRVGLRN